MQAPHRVRVCGLVFWKQLPVHVPKYFRRTAISTCLSFPFSLFLFFFFFAFLRPSPPCKPASHHLNKHFCVFWSSWLPTGAGTNRVNKCDCTKRFFCSLWLSSLCGKAIIIHWALNQGREHSLFKNVSLISPTRIGILVLGLLWLITFNLRNVFQVQMSDGLSQKRTDRNRQMSFCAWKFYFNLHAVLPPGNRTIGME